MNNAQRIALAVGAANLLLLLSFPPYDYISLARSGIPTFDGFYWFFGQHQNRIVNSDFLMLEIIVVLINAAIAALLLRTPALRQRRRPEGNRRQRIVLLLMAVNLVVVLLFPPFEFFAAITKAAVPTFEGFYFVFADNSQRQLVAPILYIEVALVIINGALLWLLFRDKTAREASADEIRALAQRVRAAQKK